MANENGRVSGGELTWWVLVAGLILLCLGLFVVYAPRTEPVIRPVVEAEEP